MRHVRSPAGERKELSSLVRIRRYCLGKAAACQQHLHSQSNLANGPWSYSGLYCYKHLGHPGFESSCFHLKSLSTFSALGPISFFLFLNFQLTLTIHTWATNRYWNLSPLKGVFFVCFERRIVYTKLDGDPKPPLCNLLITLEARWSKMKRKVKCGLTGHHIVRIEMSCLFTQ